MKSQEFACSLLNLQNKLNKKFLAFLEATLICTNVSHSANRWKSGIFKMCGFSLEACWMNKKQEPQALRHRSEDSNTRGVMKVNLANIAAKLTAFFAAATWRFVPFSIDNWYGDILCFVRQLILADVLSEKLKFSLLYSLHWWYLLLVFWMKEW